MMYDDNIILKAKPNIAVLLNENIFGIAVGNERKMTIHLTLASKLLL